MKLALMITEAPTSDARGTTARRLLAAALQAGHRADCVYFYGDGAYAALACDANRRWRQLAQAGGFELVACPSALERRGIVPEDQNGFVVRNLTWWLDHALGADRVWRF